MEHHKEGSKLGNWQIPLFVPALYQQVNGDLIDGLFQSYWQNGGY
jgi:hypothetical protein